MTIRPISRSRNEGRFTLSGSSRGIDGVDLAMTARLIRKSIVEDFAQLRKAGLTHPMMADVEKELGVSP